MFLDFLEDLHGFFWCLDIHFQLGSSFFGCLFLLFSLIDHLVDLLLKIFVHLRVRVHEGLIDSLDLPMLHKVALEGLCVPLNLQFADRQGWSEPQSTIVVVVIIVFVESDLLSNVSDLLGPLFLLRLAELALDLERAHFLQLLLEYLPPLFLLGTQLLGVLLPLGLLQLFSFAPFALLAVVGIFNRVFFLNLEHGLEPGSGEDIGCVEEPNLAIVILEEVSVHLKHLDVVNSLQVEAHFEDQT